MDDKMDYLTTEVPTTEKYNEDGKAEIDITKISLWVMFAIGLPGNVIVMIWIYLNHRRRSRINTIVLGLAAADLAVCLFVVLPNAVLSVSQITHEIMCKLFFFATGISLISSPNMVIVMAIDRHQAVIHPLKKFLSAWKLVGIGWVTATVLAVPQLFVWGVANRKQPYCSSSFGRNSNNNMTLRQVFLSYIAVITFLIPFILITFCYVRISYKIWQKVQETSGKRPSRKGKVNLKRSANGSLSKAKNKTLKMTIVIIFVFVVCNLPYFVVEMVRTFYPQGSASWLNLYSIFAAFAPFNSALNPYVFLAFNLTRRCWDDFLVILYRICPCCFKKNDKEWRQVRFSSSNSKFYNPSRTVVSEVTIVASANRQENNNGSEDVDAL